MGGFPAVRSKALKRGALVSPLLFGVASVLAPYAVNRYQLMPRDTFLPLGTVALAVLLLVGGIRLYIRRDSTAAILATLAVVLFFGYGPAAAVVGAVLGLGSDLASSPLCAIVWGVMTSLAIIMTARMHFDHDDVARTLLVVGGAIAVPLGLTLIGDTVQARLIAFPTPEQALVGVRSKPAPDVYFIILDGYARADVLLDRYRFDNSEFLDAVRSRGFCVGETSAANYGQTHLSLASSLNMCYLDAVALATGRQSSSRVPLLQMISNNRVAAAFRAAGYRYAAVSTGYLDAALAGADEYCPGSLLVSEYSMTLLGTTPLAAWHAPQYALYRRRLRDAFASIASLADGRRPFIVVAHITMPHHPFVFTADGAAISPDRRFTFSDDVGYFRRSRRTRDEYARRYVEQLRFVNSQIIKVLDSIVARSGTRPVILLQSDHGPSLDWDDPSRVDVRERLGILDASLLPDSSRGHLSQATTPVNTLRVVANLCLGSRLRLLPNRSYYSSWSRPYAFRDVTEAVRPPSPARTERRRANVQ